MIEIKSMFNSNFEITVQKNFETNNFFEKLNIFYTDTDIFMDIFH